MKRLWPLGVCVLALALLPVLGLAQSNDRGIDLQNLDDGCSPCKDFDQHANGTWKQNNPIPDEYTSWGTWQEVRERNLHTVRSILERTSAQQHAAGSVDHKVGQYYRLAMDTDRLEADGAKPLQADLKRLEGIASADDLRAFIADCHTRDIGVAFGIGVEQDLVESDRYIVYATQGGLGLPDRDYYTKQDEESIKIRQQYTEHMANMFQLLGDDAATARATAETVLAFETRLAEASMTRVEMRNPEVYYNIKTVAEATEAAPNLDWPAYFAALGLADLESFSFAQPDFFAELNTMIADTDLSQWQAYLRWHLLTDAAPYLSSAFVHEDFDFYRKTLRGAEEIQPRWKRVQSSMNWKLGEAVGKLYVAEAFPPEAKQRALKMIGDLRAALGSRLEGLEWMSADTKQKALAKLATFTPKIGYPDKWRDYGAWQVSNDSYLANVRLADHFEFRRNLDKLGKPIDRTEWGMGPQIVNAYYNPLKNEIVFPAGILQPPFFDFTIDDAVNYGAMGAVIGHELLHGFDDQGRKFNAEGSMSNWWTTEDEKKFTARAQRLTDQFNTYEVAEDTHVDGELTLGENIADLGGLTMAYYALQIALGDGDRERIDGLTPEQRFFLSWAQVWRSNAREEYLKLLVNTDSHSPARFRINGPLSNMPEFYEAFGCEEGDGMVNPTNTRVTIW